MSKNRPNNFSYLLYISDKCGNDGFYYLNDRTFVVCFAGNAFHQDCAPGSRNSGSHNYKTGHTYNYRDFCDINLVDSGYAARHSGYGAPRPAPVYPRAAPAYPNRAPVYTGHGNKYGGYQGDYKPYNPVY